MTRGDPRGGDPPGTSLDESYYDSSCFPSYSARPCLIPAAIGWFGARCRCLCRYRPHLRYYHPRLPSLSASTKHPRPAEQQHDRCCSYHTSIAPRPAQEAAA
ncbi:hypothetical protein GALMADRAFT_162474, partial [Galerina marginata CBS 339.88]